MGRVWDFWIFRSSQCVPIKFPLTSQHAPQVPNVFAIAPHFIPLYSHFQIRFSDSHNRSCLELFSRIPQLFHNGSCHTSYEELHGVSQKTSNTK